MVSGRCNPQQAALCKVASQLRISSFNASLFWHSEKFMLERCFAGILFLFARSPNLSYNPNLPKRYRQHK
jgi:hypothetical protein